jgi:hypothetical protein
MPPRQELCAASAQRCWAQGGVQHPGSWTAIEARGIPEDRILLSTFYTQGIYTQSNFPRSQLCHGTRSPNSETSGDTMPFTQKGKDATAPSLYHSPADMGSTREAASHLFATKACGQARNSLAADRFF